VPYPTEYGFDRSFVCHEGIGDRVLFHNNANSRRSSELGRGKITWADKHQLTGIYVDSALAFISRKGDTPFYLNLCPNDVHDAHIPAPGTEKAFQSLTENPFEQRFLAVLTELDKQIGRFIDELRKMGELENTIIVFTSDNGPTDWPRYYDRRRYPEGYQGELYPPGFTGGFFGRKWSLYEGGIRMPFIISWPGCIPAGKTDDRTIIAAADLFPSLCSLLGFEWPENLDGIDKSQALLGAPMQVTDPIMWQYACNPGGSLLPGNPDYISPNLAMREGKWKLLINADSTRTELYNLEKDPGETTNLAEEESERAMDMASRLIAWRRTMPVTIRKD
jgi:arylsulfatase A-like enzyme